MFMANLGSSASTVSNISKRAEIKRSTAYQYIESLIQKGLMHKTTVGKRTLYSIESPNKLLSLLDQKRKRMENLLPKLQSLYSTSAKQAKIRFYEGKEGLTTVYEEIFNTTQIIYAVYSPEKFFQVFTEEEQDVFFMILEQSGGRIYDMVEQSPSAKQYIKHSHPMGVKRVKLLPEDFRLSTDILIAGDTVALISFTNLTAVVIENPDIAHTQKELLKFM